MKKWSWNVRAQVTTGFAIVFVMVVLLGAASFFQTQSLYGQARTLYEHPLQVRQAVSQLKADIFNSRLGIRDLILMNDEQERGAAVQTIQSSLEDGEVQLDTIYSLYLGPISDVDKAYGAYNDWRGMTEYRITQVLGGIITAQNYDAADTADTYRDQMLNAIQVIERFAINKADELSARIVHLYDAVNLQILILYAGALALALVIGSLMIRAVRRPLAELNESITRFHKGDMDARSAYDKNNEFGVLTDSFNSMADTLQKSIALHERSQKISDIMLTTENAHEFFRKTLGELAGQTGAQMAAAYLYEPDTKLLRYYESVGLSSEAKAAFDAEGLEGLFGPAVLSGKVQMVKDIPQDTEFAFQAPCCQLIPREIMAIPVLSGRQTVAMISLACVSAFREDTVELIESILPTMSARIEGVLAYRTIRRFSGQLEEKNRELDAQKDELAAQAAELTHQNTELEMQKNQLAEASRLKTSFLSNMSHELRTPLNSIIALSGVLNRRLSGMIPEEEYGYLDVIERNGKSLLQLINEILDISRIEAGREEVAAAEFSLGELIEEIAGTLRPQADQKGVRLLADAKEPGIRMMSDAGKCRHILMNIIGNAIKFTEKGKVEVFLQKKADRAEIRIADTGIGISAENLPHIFDEFRQADGGTARRYGGTGLGLSIAKKYTELLGGTITVSSEEGRGTVFTVLLPLRYEEPADEETGEWAETDVKEAAGRYEPAVPGEQKTVLLIEDSEPQIIQIKDLLLGTGYRILAARSAAEAFEIIRTGIPDAIILDLMMPEVDGFETLGALREAPGTMDTPVLILTAKHITKDDLKFLKQNHIHQLIRKGDIDRDKLLGEISAMLVSPQKEEPEKMEAGAKPLVLVVEDNPDNMITVKALLSEDYRVIGAEDGEQGVALAKKHVPDLILMDIELPGIGGIEAYKKIRENPALNGVPVIALTASAMEEERETILAHGFDAFIAKPVATGEFFKVIGEVLNGR